MARFFGVFAQKIRAEIKTIFKAGLLNEWDCMRCNRYMDKGLEKQIELYNLDVLIFLAYRLDSFEAKIFREFQKMALNSHLLKQKRDEANIVWAYLSHLCNIQLN
jgi:hypothetical protein